MTKMMLRERLYPAKVAYTMVKPPVAYVTLLRHMRAGYLEYRKIGGRYYLHLDILRAYAEGALPDG